MEVIMKITYYGHSAFIIEDKDFKAIIDPFITGNPQARCSIDEINGLTHIFVTHNHGDHLGDCIELAKKDDALVITNFEIANFLNDNGVKTHGMHIGGRHRFNFGTVKLTVALHGGNPCGFIIEVNGKKIYHAGDTGLTLDMKLLESENVDLALIPIGGNYTMDIYDAIKAVEFIKPKLVIPMHYNTFEIIEADPHEFRSLNKTCETIILDSGLSVEI